MSASGGLSTFGKRSAINIAVFVSGADPDNRMSWAALLHDHHLSLSLGSYLNLRTAMTTFQVYFASAAGNSAFFIGIM